MNYDKIMLLGDMHGDYGVIEQRVIEAAELGVPIFQLGDFGYWRNTSKGNEFHNKIIALLALHKVDLFFLRGNHEFTKGHEVSDVGTVAGLLDLKVNYGNSFHTFPNSEYLHYIIDGKPWEMGGKTFVAVGGAHSIDYRQRTRYVSWWPEEDVSEEVLDDILRSKAQYPKVDYFLSHETIEHNYIYEILNPHPIGKSAWSRRVLKEIVYELQPGQLFHGHWHHHYSTTVSIRNGKPLQIVGLAENLSDKRYHRIFLNIQTGRWSNDYSEII